MPTGIASQATVTHLDGKQLPLLLLVEDDAAMRKFLRAFLIGAGYRVEEAACAQEAVLLAPQCLPSLVILDLGLPDLDGQELLQQLREWFTAPIIILSVRDQDAQKVAALDSGADDYLTKPFSTSELLARIREALRQAVQVQSVDQLPLFEVGSLKVDLAARQVFLRDREIHLTPIEYKLLTTLVRYAGKVVTHQQLAREAWGPDKLHDTQHLRVFMSALRRKIELNLAQPRYVLTERGIGYRMATD
jgi:two-component system KDP operon response regulator KdpE